MRHAFAAIAATTTMLAAAAAPAALAQDQAQMRYLAGNCANCHGTDGVSAGGMPSLAGQARSELVSQMKEFRAGTRPATIMHQLAKGYTDAQIELLAEHFSRQPRPAGAQR